MPKYGIMDITTGVKTMKTFLITLLIISAGIAGYSISRSEEKKWNSIGALAIFITLLCIGALSTISIY